MTLALTKTALNFDMKYQHSGLIIYELLEMLFKWIAKKINGR